MVQSRGQPCITQSLVESDADDRDRSVNITSVRWKSSFRSGFGLWTAENQKAAIEAWGKSISMSPSADAYTSKSQVDNS